jgi:hypothetical protein
MPLRTSEPLSALVPAQPPEAEQLVAFAVDQVSVLLPPLTTLVGEADNATVGKGTGATVTFTVWAVLPPGPVQARAKLAFAASGALVSLPLVARDPLQLPEAAHAVALLLDQEILVVPPGLTDVGLAVRVRVGAAGPVGVTETTTVLAAAPPAPEQVSVKLVLEARAAMDSEPLAGRAPLQPPEAAHPVALVDVQASVVAPP